MSAIDAKTRGSCDGEHTCVSGSKGAFPKWTTIPQAFKDNGYLSLGVGKLFHDGGHNFGANSGPDEADVDPDHPDGNGTPPNADPLSWTNCPVQYPDFSTVPGEYPPALWPNSYPPSKSTQNSSYLCPSGEGKCPHTGTISQKYCLEDVPMDGAGADPPLLDYPVYKNAIDKMRFAAKNYNR
jgi:hypothetical protein